MANSDIGSCRDYFTPGCTDSIKLGYNVLATIDDGSCRDLVLGCMNPTSTNYNSLATRDDGTCILVNLGCTDPLAINYESAAEAEHPDPYFGCKFYTPGCANKLAWNYDAVATDDDGSCIPDRVKGLVLPRRLLPSVARAPLSRTRSHSLALALSPSLALSRSLALAALMRHVLPFFHFSRVARAALAALFVSLCPLPPSR